MATVTYTFRRHGNAEVAPDQSYQADMARQLSNVGIQQVERIRQRFDLVYAAPAMRTRQTSSRMSPFPLEQVTVLSELGYPEPNNDIGQRCVLMYRAYGTETPYAEYMKDPDFHLLRKDCMAAARAIRKRKLPTDAVVGFACHGTYMNGIGIAILEERVHDLVDPIAELKEQVFDETEGFTLTMEAGRPVD